VRDYFTELSCAYLDRSSCFPFNREDLKNYDDVGYDLMVKTWEEKEKAKR
jgi:hypothetical protein